MKRIHQILFGLCLAGTSLTLASCSDDLLDPLASQAAEGTPIVLNASSNGSATRMVLDEDGLTTYWKAGDKLTLVAKDGTQAPIELSCGLEGDEQAQETTFKSESGVPAGTYWVIYNYNENLTYGTKTFQSVDQINNDDSFVLYGELNVVSGTSSYSVELSHLYSLIRIKLENVPNSWDQYHNYQIGMYSTQKGFPKYKQFTSNGLVSADYGYTYYNYSYNNNYYVSNARQHNVFLGYYNYHDQYTDYVSSYDENGYTSGTEEVIVPSNQNEMEGQAALVFPEDLSSEDVFFYAIYDNTCYEFKKSNKVNLKEGTNYTVILDFNEANKTSLSYDSSTGAFLISSTDEWRNAAYRSAINNYQGNYYTYKLTDNLSFKDTYFFPLNAAYIYGNNVTLSDITLDRANEDNVGLYKNEYISSDNSYDYANKEYYSCSISDLTLDNVTIKGRSFVGAFGGINVAANNCKVIGESSIVGSGNYVGGIVGWNHFNYNEYYYCIHGDNCLTDVSVGQSCSIEGNDYVGGIIGASQFNTYYNTFKSTRIALSGCTLSGTVKGHDYVGGIFGIFGGSRIDGSNNSYFSFSDDSYTLVLRKCKNYGSVEGNNYVGGIGGDFSMYTYTSGEDRVILKESLSEGKVSGNKFVGGILGETYASVKTCYSINDVTATDSEVGGIVGYCTTSGYQPRITSCYSLANITSEDYTKAGGIVGRAGWSMAGSIAATIKYCYYASKNMIGNGILGYSDGYCTVENCLTATGSLGSNLGEHQYSEEWNTYNFDDTLNDNYTNVTSILDNKSVINGDNAYSDNYWTPLEDYPYYCVKFDSFEATTNNPNLKDETIQ